MWPAPARTSGRCHIRSTVAGDEIEGQIQKLRSQPAITVDDPGAYSRPFRLRYTAELMPNAELMEYICDNEQDAANIDAPADAAIDAAKLPGQ